MTITEKRTYNEIGYLLLPLIKGVNHTIIGDNLIDVYISKKVNDYKVYVLCEEECEYLERFGDDKHPQFEEVVIVDVFYLYVMNIPYQYNADIRTMKDNKLSLLSDGILEHTKKYSGLKEDGIEEIRNYVLAKNKLQGKGLLAYKFFTKKTKDLYDELFENPFYNVNNIGGIKTYKHLEEEYQKFRVGKLDPLVISDVYNGEPLTVSENSFIENLNL